MQALSSFMDKLRRRSSAAPVVKAASSKPCAEAEAAATSLPPAGPPAVAEDAEDRQRKKWDPNAGPSCFSAPMSPMSPMSPTQKKTTTVREPSPESGQRAVSRLKRGPETPMSPEQKAKTIRKPSPEQKKATTIRKPSPEQKKATTIREPSPEQKKAKTIRKPSPEQKKATTILEPSPETGQRAVARLKRGPEAPTEGKATTTTQQPAPAPDGVSAMAPKGENPAIPVSPTAAAMLSSSSAEATPEAKGPGVGNVDSKQPQDSSAGAPPAAAKEAMSPGKSHSGSTLSSVRA
ncbi:hypothetical protein V5799_026870 [Amblyomma americanum]|uniref:Uncharacterized protein n=1 Tax=Amblyomma americanum TaxID=6943 RepID=A0AAQ4DHD3_AMBAM